MKKRVDFCEKIIEKKIKGDNIFFTDETKIDMSPYTNDSIRLTNESKIKLKRGDLEVYDLINRQEKKFEKSLIIAGGLSAFGLSRLIVLEGTLNEFAYGQSLLNFKEDIDSINKKYNANLFLEQDGARAHTSKSNLKLINELFGDKWIQNPPNSPDLAYPIEALWGIIKPRIKRRNPKTIQELKQFTLEEWNSVPPQLLKNLCSNYLKRIEKVLELNGARLEPEHLRQLSKKKNDLYEWKIPKKLSNIEIVYNDEKLKKIKK